MLYKNFERVFYLDNVYGICMCIVDYQVFFVYLKYYLKYFNMLFDFIVKFRNVVVNWFKIFI